MNHLSDADGNVEQQAGCRVGQGKVLDQELMESRLALQHTGQCEACIHTHTHTWTPQTNTILFKIQLSVSGCILYSLKQKLPSASKQTVVSLYIKASTDSHTTTALCWVFMGRLDKLVSSRIHSFWSFLCIPVLIYHVIYQQYVLFVFAPCNTLFPTFSKFCLQTFLLFCN